ncbi:twin-arginine translocation pathway signal protein [Curvibacter sp. APW13]|uniref:Acg family FMN-binding oxidoreductase n=1 Tax=Curvibacter sp. APW13 TaxID=3077236 RepID=UPI0028DE80A4|nr:twin-arginine translocation pathway signal protein [Curvibacter sp. APW13]MDT8990848.1 twin-arginine translocation pathway signal protein [Curvibacter sp. APW13]
MQRRKFIRLAGGGTIAAAVGSTAALSGCSAQVPDEAIEAWQDPYNTVTSGDVRHWIVSYAILAPHSHNLQSWVVDLRRPFEIWLYCDPKRLLPETDPHARQIMMSHGTFLELLVMAAKERAYRADITLFPQGEFAGDTPDGRPIARVHLSTDTSVAKDPLFAQILQRHTNRELYDPKRPVPSSAWLAMGASLDTSVRFGFVTQEDEEAIAKHRQIAKEAYRIEMTTPRTVLESYRWLRMGAGEVNAHRDGISIMAPLPVLLSKVGLFDRNKAPAPDSYATTGELEDFGKKIASTPAFVWLMTRDNSRATQIAAGRAWVRLQLEATAQGLAMQPLSQALQEYPEQQRPYNDIHRLCGAAATGQTLQMWARVGFAPPVRPAPRRPFADFLRKA